MNESQNMGNNRPVYRSSQQGRARSRTGSTRRGAQGQGRVRATSPQLHGRGYQTPGQRRRNANGYQLQRHPINFAGRRGMANRLDPRLIVLAAVALVLVIVIVFNVVSCAGSANEPKAEVSSKVSDDLQQQLTTAVTTADRLKYIAEHAEEYPEALVSLALAEPASIDFVYDYPSANRDTAAEYTGTVTKGEVPALFGWDERWGYLGYGDSLIALTGSGPVACAMARMALTGETDQTPATIAQAAADAGKATGNAGTDPSFFTDKAKDLGMSVTALDISKPLDSGSSASADDQGSDDASGADASTDASTEGTKDNETGSSASSSRLSNADLGSRISSTLGATTYLLVETSGGALGSTAHWVLVCAGEDGAVTVHDPTSTDNSSHAWDPTTVASDLASALVVTTPSES